MGVRLGRSTGVTWLSKPPEDVPLSQGDPHILYCDNLIETYYVPSEIPGQYHVKHGYERAAEFARLLATGTNEIEAQEQIRLQRTLTGPPFHKGFEWVPAWMDSVREGLQAVQAAI